MKYEDEYKDCFDYLFFGIDHDSLFDILRDNYYVDIIDKDAFKKLIFQAIETAHEAGYIKPLSQESIDAMKAEWLEKFRATPTSELVTEVK